MTQSWNHEEPTGPAAVKRSTATQQKPRQANLGKPFQSEYPPTTAVQLPKILSDGTVNLHVLMALDLQCNMHWQQTMLRACTRTANLLNPCISTKPTVHDIMIRCFLKGSSSASCSDFSARRNTSRSATLTFMDPLPGHCSTNKMSSEHMAQEGETHAC